MKSNCTEANLRLSEIATKVGDHTEAHRYVLKALKCGSSDAGMLAMLGQASLKLGRSDEAIKAFEQAFALQPQDESTSLTLARLYQKMGRDQDAVVCYKKQIGTEAGGS